jgi:predicted nucleotidyltransferase
MMVFGMVNIATRYANAVKNEFSPIAVILFGSYAKGSANYDSDIDIDVMSHLL